MLYASNLQLTHRLSLLNSHSADGQERVWLVRHGFNFHRVVGQSCADLLNKINISHSGIICDAQTASTPINSDHLRIAYGYMDDIHIEPCLQFPRRIGKSDLSCHIAIVFIKHGFLVCWQERAAPASVCWGSIRHSSSIFVLMRHQKER